MNNMYQEMLLNSFRKLVSETWLYELNITNDDDNEDSAREAKAKTKPQRGFFNE